jgi:hypothetical protein
MKKNQLLLLLLLGVVLAVAAFLVSKKQAAPYKQASRAGAKLLPDLEINAVASLSIRSGSNAVTLAKQGEVWVVKERGNYPANFGTISDLMRKFWELKIARTVQAGSSRLPMLGLAGPDKNSTLVEMKAEDGKLIRSVLLGASSQSDSRGGSGRYVMVGNDPKTISFVADSLSDVDAAADRWLNKDFFKVEKLKSIKIVTPIATNNWQMTRTSESADWKLSGAKKDEKLDSSKTSSLSSLLSYPSFNDVIPGTAALDKPTVATLTTFDGFTYTVKTAKQTDENYHLQVAVTAKLVKERTPGKDEKPEDKTKLDKEFKDNLKKLEEKLKTEQSLGKWTYIVSKWTVEQLLKDRKDFLAEKKAEEKPATDQPK